MAPEYSPHLVIQMERVLVDLSELQQYFTRSLELHVLHTGLEYATGKVQTVVPILKGGTPRAKRQQPVVLPGAVVKMLQITPVFPIAALPVFGDDGLHFPRRLAFGDLQHHFGYVVQIRRDLFLLPARVVEGVAADGLGFGAPEFPNVVTGFLRKLGVHAPSDGIEDVVVRRPGRLDFDRDHGYVLCVRRLERQMILVLVDSSDATMNETGDCVTI